MTLPPSPEPEQITISKSRPNPSSVEMDNLPSQSAAPALVADLPVSSTADSITQPIQSSSDAATSPAEPFNKPAHDSSYATVPSAEAITETAPATSHESPSQSNESEISAGPTTSTAAAGSPSAGPVIHLRLLHPNGQQYPLTLDADYLRKRKVNVTDDNPENLTVYTLKELILRGWKEEWQARPSSPNYIRLIHFGRMLDDKAPLRDYKFITNGERNMVHMSIKPQESVEDDSDPKQAPHGGGGSSRSACCGCVIL